MARKPRDYKAEERRRNELARQRGFTSRYQQRRKIETGVIPAIQPKRVRSPRTLTAQQKRLQPPKHKGKIQDEFLGVKVSRQQRATDWSTLFAHDDIVKYRPENAEKLGISKTAYTNAYLRAFVIGDERYSQVRHNHHGGSADMYYWFVTLHNYYQAEEYEERYGPIT